MPHITHAIGVSEPSLGAESMTIFDFGTRLDRK